MVTYLTAVHGIPGWNPSMSSLCISHKTTAIYSPAHELHSIARVESAFYRSWNNEYQHMGARRALASPENVAKCFICCNCCLKSSQTKYVSIIVRKCQLLGVRPKTHTGALPPLDPAGGLPSFKPHHCPSLEKNHAGAHDINFRAE